MKTLVITFMSAIAIVVAALTYDMITSDGNANDHLVGKTIVSHDSLGRPVNLLTLTTTGKEWKETMMKQNTYNGNSVTSATYIKENGNWVATTKFTYDNVDGTLALTKIEQMTPDGNWATQAEIDLADLSEDDGMMNDMVFDADGNLVMNATYLYKGDNRTGIQKEEYTYEGSQMKRTTSYSWGENGNWQKQIVTNMFVK